MKPYKTLLLLLVFMVFLYGPSLLQYNRISISDSIVIELPDAKWITDSFTGLMTNKPGGEIVTDTVTAVADTDSLLPDKPLIQGIVYPGSSDARLSLPVLPPVNNGQVRIIYYGDSQLEGDRITDELRKLMRLKYGGTGPGLISPTMLVPYTRTSYIRSSSNWERYNYLSIKNGDIEHNNLGPMLSFSRFQTQPGTISSAWIKITPSNTADSLARCYERLRIFYGNLHDSVTIEIVEDNRSEVVKSLKPSEGPVEFSYRLDKPETVEIRFTGHESPDIYGISLESDSGLVIDNIPLRGSAGLEYTATGKDNLESIYRMLDPDLIILQFGLNIVLNIRDDYTYYENRLFDQVSYLKLLCPDAMILVIGVTDMAREVDSEIHSYPNIPLIVEAQRDAAARAGVMFWDSREAMGGEDAIVQWRQHDPPLAYNDYTHISYDGGTIMGSLLSDALLSSACESTVIPDTSIYQVVRGDSSLTESRSVIPADIVRYNPGRHLIFSSASFWIFLMVLLAGYSILFKRPLLRNSYLFLFSLFFYYKSGGLFFILLIISTITDYGAGLLIYYSKRLSVKKLWVFMSLLVNLGMLGYFKYSGFITDVINRTFSTSFPQYDWLAIFSNRHLGTGFDISSVILPVGISFFTFQTISYTLDVYRGRTRPVKNILDFGFYVSFFPQLVAGPIVRASEFIPQLYQRYTLTKNEWGHAIFLIISGLIKKIVVSDFIALNLIDRVLSSPGVYSAIENLVSIYGYGLQIYCDFSGYTDIAIGVALLLGFRLPVNFNSPYKAINITDFWRRWHISLSRWLKDYLYISLGGNRKGKLRTNINLMVTMLLGGLWHGAGLRFIIWGGLHGIGLVLHKAWRTLFPGRRGGSKFWRLISLLITFNFVTFCWIFFRVDSMEKVSALFYSISSGLNPGDILLFLKSYTSVAIVIAAGYILHFLPSRIKESYRGLFIRLPLAIKMVFIYIVAVALFNIQSTDIQPFIYFRF